MVEVMQHNTTQQDDVVNNGGSGELAASFKLVTKRFGEMEVDPEQVIRMVSPVLGFPESRRFVLRPHGPGSAFLWLQSLENGDLAFVVVRAGQVDAGYNPPLVEADRQELGLVAGQVPEFLLILTLSRKEKLKITANMLGPVALNAEKRFAKQVLLDPAHYDIAFPVE